MEQQKIYAKEELAAQIDKIGHKSGAEIEVTGLNGGEEFTIMIVQTEWYETPVCLIGGYGNPGRLQKSCQPYWMTISTRIRFLQSESYNR